MQLQMGRGKRERHAPNYREVNTTFGAEEDGDDPAEKEERARKRIKHEVSCEEGGGGGGEGERREKGARERIEERRAVTLGLMQRGRHGKGSGAEREAKGGDVVCRDGEVYRVRRGG